MQYRLLALPIVAAVSSFGLASAARADIASIDNFSFTVGRTTVFNDTFSEGTTLNPGVSPSGINFSSGSPANYLVQGTITESGGVANLNTATGVLVPATAAPFPLIRETSASLLASVANTAAFSTSAIYNLSIPTATFSTYGIELVDLNAANNGSIAALRVEKTASGTVVTFLKLDRINNVATILGSALLDTTHQQILLELMQSTGGSDLISASYEYLDNGIGGPLTTFADTANMFDDGATTIRPAFDAFDAVPEPATLALLLGGFIGWGWFGARGSRRAT